MTTQRIMALIGQTIGQTKDRGHLLVCVQGWVPDKSSNDDDKGTLEEPKIKPTMVRLTKKEQ